MPVIEVPRIKRKVQQYPAARKSLAERKEATKGAPARQHMIKEQDARFWKSVRTVENGKKISLSVYEQQVLHSLKEPQYRKQKREVSVAAAPDGKKVYVSTRQQKALTVSANGCVEVNVIR